MGDIKILLIGEEQYNNENYENYNYNDFNIPSHFEKVAFIPKTRCKKTFDLKSIVSYKRILGVINKIQINDDNFHAYHENISNTIQKLASNGIYLVNKTELENYNNLQNHEEIDKHTKFVCFGEKAFECVKDRVRDNYIYLYPHPSHKNKSAFWNEYLLNTKFYSTSKDLNDLL
ncbi:hypothetical protein NGG52_01565 [Mammaliicoccus sciuri]|uniref:hypothetical protein n=1 Tax=Mammaliicoccus sciuri TaxID=1296 RepID=UPI002DB6E10B|nr:hypothetical protein [Mammaliicoccus sciuri]MEB8372826.1 hypothetical protein [Mammaliicoccus sciuri]